jgi:hypothetical protein
LITFTNIYQCSDSQISLLLEEKSGNLNKEQTSFLNKNKNFSQIKTKETSLASNSNNLSITKEKKYERNA